MSIGGGGFVVTVYLPNSVSCVRVPESMAQWRTTKVSPVVSEWNGLDGCELGFGFVLEL